jgi:hypothetical protein
MYSIFNYLIILKWPTWILSGPVQAILSIFAKTASIGSSALYMLLLLYDHAGGGTTDITISNASRIVKKHQMSLNFQNYLKSTGHS